jgi:hypothetical protein
MDILSIFSVVLVHSLINVVIIPSKSFVSNSTTSLARSMLQISQLVRRQLSLLSEVPGNARRPDVSLPRCVRRGWNILGPLCARIPPDQGAEDKVDMEAWLMHHKFSGRVEPVFRRIRLDIDRTEQRNKPNDIETGRPQDRRIPDEGSSNQNGGQQ